MREMVEAVRVPPQSIEAEQSVLGGLMLDNRAWDRVCDVVTERDFYRHDHRKIFKHIACLIDSNMPADTLTVCEALNGTDVDRQYVGLLPLNTPSAANIRRYAEIVREASRQRDVVAIATELADAAYTRNADVGELIAGAVERLYSLQRNVRRGSRPIEQILTSVVEKLDQLYSRTDKREVVGVATGFVDLDAKTAGLQRGDLIIIAGRPSMGKTALAMNMTEYVTVTSKEPALVFSLEMSDEQLAQRMIGSVGRLDQHELRTGQFKEEDWTKVTETVGKLSEAPIIIEETAGLTVSDVRAIAHRTYRERGGLGLVVIDYLQLMSSSGDNRNNELGEITRSLKALAKDLRVPVIALSQLNRGVEQRTNKRPVMSDLRDSGSIEQDADLILLLYRDEVYDSDTPNKGIAEVIIGKQRSGPIGTVLLTFIAKYARFENFAGQLQGKATKPRSKPFEMRQRADIDG